MATNLLRSISHHNSLRRRRHTINPLPTTINASFLKPTTTQYSLSHSTTTTTTTTTCTISSATYSTTDPSTSQNISYELLQHHLSNKNYQQADEETRRLVIVLAGEAAQKRGYVFFSEVKFIAESDLKKIDGLWRQYSDNKFGYSVQKKIWKKVNGDFTKFFIKVGWMKKLESSEVVQYNYRSFPGEFIWEMDENTPEGHLPLTNALRGTQLLNSILSHPAFQENEEGEDEEEEEEEVKKRSEKEGRDNNGGIKPLSRNFKPNYTF